MLWSILIDVILLLFTITYFVKTFLNGFKNKMTFKEIIKSNYFLMLFYLLILYPIIIKDFIRYLLK
ncbi:hypothetical protein AN960_12850 [Bacillus sp. FJAT-25509]|nr:hypothetical protein AN960_12850 [Bacillus sp. FJAT-25509]